MLPASGSGSHWHWLGPHGPLFLEQFCQKKGEINRLLRVKPRIADRVIAVVEISFANCAGAASAFRDILPCHLQMHAPGVGAFGLMNLEAVADLFQDQIEGPGLVTARRGDCVAMHRITRPQHHLALALYGADEWRKKLTNLLGTKAANQREPAWLIVGIQDLDQTQ